MSNKGDGGLTSQERDTRRSKIIRRWAAYRIGRAQREIWRRRRVKRGIEEPDNDDAIPVDDDLLAELPESLLS